MITKFSASEIHDGPEWQHFRPIFLVIPARFLFKLTLNGLNVT